METYIKGSKECNEATAVSANANIVQRRQPPTNSYAQTAMENSKRRKMRRDKPAPNATIR